MPRLPRLALLCLTLLLAPLARADELANAQRLWLAGQRDAAVGQIESALVANPGELRLRFALGVMRLELGQAAKAREIFTGLTQDFPDLADPYNNLAVIHAAAGELDQARVALEQALRLQPDHVQAQENLGDVLLRLAARAYGRAAEASLTPNPGVANKLKRTQALASELRLVR
jgi:tetratricopeptide (TPR) repeat protein